MFRQNVLSLVVFWKMFYKTLLSKTTSMLRVLAQSSPVFLNCKPSPSFSFWSQAGSLSASCLCLVCHWWSCPRGVRDSGCCHPWVRCGLLQHPQDLWSVWAHPLPEAQALMLTSRSISCLAAENPSGFVPALHFFSLLHPPILPPSSLFSTHPFSTPCYFPFLSPHFLPPPFLPPFFSPSFPSISPRFVPLLPPHPPHLFLPSFFLPLPLFFPPTCLFPTLPRPSLSLFPSSSSGHLSACPCPVQSPVPFHCLLFCCSNCILATWHWLTFCIPDSVEYRWS